VQDIGVRPTQLTKTDSSTGVQAGYRFVPKIGMDVEIFQMCRPYICAVPHQRLINVGGGESSGFPLSRLYVKFKMSHFSGAKRAVFANNSEF
jgi:hypothetical protein